MKTRWLHISDIHFNIDQYQRWNQNKDATELISFVEGLRRSNSLDFNYLLFTGDLSYNGFQEEFEIGKNFLDGILDVCNLSKEQLIIIPGNHDNCRNDLSDTIKNTRTRLKQLNVDQDFDEYNTIQYESICNYSQYSTGLKNYYRFLKEYFLDTGINIIDQKPYFVKNFTIDGICKICFIGLNTAFVSYGGEDDKGVLLLGAKQVDDAIRESNQEATQIKVCLMHHPNNWLTDFDNNYVVPILHNNCDFLLFGHIHKNRFQLRELLIPLLE